MPVRRRLVLTTFGIIFVLLNLSYPAAAGQPPSHHTGLSRSLFAQKRSDFALKDRDRVVFYGDSITEQRLYTSYIEHYVLTRYPDRRVTFINTGWGGDKVSSNDCKPCAGVGGLARLKRDVIDHRPTVVTLLFGMNDGQYRDFDPAISKVYEDGLTAIIRELKSKTGARIYVMTPTVYDGTRHTPWSKTDRYNDVLDRYSEAVKAIAQREGLDVVDLHSVTTEALARMKKDDSDYTFAPDGVHPQEDGQLLMAAEILRAWGAPVGGLELSKQVTLDPDGTTSLSVAAPLPWPEPLPSEKLRRLKPMITDIGKVLLLLTGLPSGEYKIAIDGKDAGQYTSQALSGGIPVSLLSAKATDDTRKLAGLVRKRCDLFFLRWRQIEAPFATEYQSTSKAVSSLDLLIAEMQERTRLLGAFHKYQLVVSRTNNNRPVVSH
jgi:lysophospholipase L1-like esterase